MLLRFVASVVIMLGLAARATAADAPRDEALLTVAERSGFRATARYDEVKALLERLAGSSGLVRLDELGRSVEGRSIPVLILSDPPVATPEEAARSGKLVVLLTGNIHAGEVCGKEALPMLARELAATPGHPLLRDLILAMVPILNADGNERVALDNRPGQLGPELGMGQRPNAQGFDLNRDFMKLEAPETRALVRFIDRWDPDLIIDTHATNGSYHRYTITYQGPKNPAGDRSVVEFARDAMLPAVGSAFREQTGLRAFAYGNFDRDHARWTTYPATPRFGTSYMGLRNRLAILSEAYAYATYEARVLATRDFVRACLQYAAAHKDEIGRLLDRARDATTAAGRRPRADDLVALRSEARAFPEPVTVLGFVEQERDGVKVATDEPKDYRVALEQDFVPMMMVRRPFAYLIPPGYGAVVANLLRHGIAVETLSRGVERDQEVYRIIGMTHADRPYEGHRTVLVDVAAREDRRRVEDGTLVIRTAQPLGTLAVYLLEPHSDDGLCTWNYFDEALEIGEDFPVRRLLAPCDLATTPVRPPGEAHRSP